MDFRIPYCADWLIGVRRLFTRIFQVHPVSSSDDPIRIYQQIVEANPSGMLLVDALDPRHPIIYVNEAFERSTGYSFDEVQGRNCRFLQGKDRNQPDLAIIRRALQQEEPCVATLRNYRKDGSMFWNEVRISPLRNAQGIVTHYVGIQNDITARKDAEEELARSEHLYRQIFEDNRAIKLLIDPHDGRIVQANAAAADFYGYPRHVLQTMYIHQINILSEEEVYAEMQQASKQDRSYFQFRHRLASGEIRDVDVFSSPVDMPEGRCLYSIIVDVSERREAERRYYSLFEQSNDAVFILDLEGNHVAVNQRGAKMLGYTPEEVVQLSFRDLVVPEEHSLSLNARDRMLAGETLPPYERTARRKDGSTFQVEINVEMVRDDEGNPLHIQSIVRDVSERKRMEETLRESEWRFRGAIEASIDAFFMMESVRDGDNDIIDFRIVEINDQAAKMMSMSREQLIGGLICELFPINRENGFFDRYKQVALTGHPIEEEFRVPNGYAAPGWYYHQVVKVGDGVAIVTSDISERKRMEESLRESEYRFRGFVEHSSDGVVMVDEEGRIIEWNDSMVYLTEMKASEVRGKYLWDVQFSLADEALRTPTTYEHLKGMIQHALQTGDAPWLFTPHESLVVSKHGVRNFVQSVMFPIPTRNGIQVGSILRDISEQKRMENALRESEARLRAMIEAIPDTIFRNSVDGTYLDWHAPERDYMVESPEQFMGSKIEDVLPPSLAQEQMQAIQRAVRTGHVVTHEFTIPLPSGQRQFEVRIVPVGDDEVVSIVRDVTEVRRAQQQHIELTLEKERTQMLTAFIQNAAHEFRTPLANISTSAYLMSRLEDPERREEKVRRINTHITQITHLVDMLTMMVKLEKPDSLARQPVNMVAIVQFVCRERLEKYRGKPEFSCKLQEDVPDVQGDLTYLTAALTQVLDNAMRYTPPDGQVTITLCHEGNALQLVIEDTGMGIAPENLPRIFETFYRKDEAHTTPGFGLGLPMAQKIIHRHGGDIEVESELGQGTRVKITLPVERANPHS